MLRLILIVIYLITYLINLIINFQFIMEHLNYKLNASSLKNLKSIFQIHNATK